MTWIDSLSAFKEANIIGFIETDIIFDESWEDFINYRKQADTNRPVRWENNNLSITFEIPGSPLMQKFKSFNLLRDGLYEIWSEKVWDEPAIIMSDIIDNSGGLGEHTDPCPQIHMSCIGSTEWTIKQSNGQYIKKILNPGELVYLPTGTPHSVKPLTSPRVGIAYSIRV